MDTSVKGSAVFMAAVLARSVKIEAEDLFCQVKSSPMKSLKRTFMRCTCKHSQCRF